MHYTAPTLEKPAVDLSILIPIFGLPRCLEDPQQIREWGTRCGDILDVIPATPCQAEMLEDSGHEGPQPQTCGEAVRLLRTYPAYRDGRPGMLLLMFDTKRAVAGWYAQLAQAQDEAAVETAAASYSARMWEREDRP